MDRVERQSAHVRILDPLVAQQVAAGEVVDRPASVVKELLENALDAHSSRIEIDLSDGGRQRLLVRDDGSGMGAEDAEKSVLAHATSKIASVEDLEVVGTLGFRGEALPSIASVSDFSLITATGDGTGTRVSVGGGAPANVSAASHPKGTTVVVDRLFYNVPARRAFLKAAKTERAAIVESVTHLAIAYPQVAFKITEGGREVLSLPAAKEWKQRLAQVYGVGKVRTFRPVSHQAGPYDIRGYAAPPNVTYTSRASCQTVSVNGRWVRVESLGRAIDDAYRGTVPAGRYPALAFDIRINPRQVDVNVHPTKQLVRFSDERALRSAVGEALKLAMEWAGQRPSSSTSGGEKPWRQDRSDRNGNVAGRPASARTEGGDRELFPSRDSQQARSQTSNEQRKLEPGELPEARHCIRDTSVSPPTPANLSDEDSAAPAPPAPESPQPSKWPGEMPERGMLPDLQNLRVVGQVGNGYIMLDEPSAIWFVDQHVAHERGILDGLLDPETPPTVQPLLIPQVVELSPGYAALAAESLEELSVYGFEAEPFGSASMRITSVISTLAEKDVPGAFLQAVAAIEGSEAGMVREQRILATIACHSAVKLGDRLSHAEMEALVRDWLTSRLPDTCPHGRSICFRMDHKDIARRLDRH